MRRRQAFSPTLGPLEQRICLAGDVGQVGDFQGQFGDQTTPDSPGSGGEISVPEASGLTAAARPTGTVLTAAQHHHGGVHHHQPPPQHHAKHH